MLMRRGADARLGIEIFGRERAMLDVLGAKKGDIGQDMPLPPGAAVIHNHYT
jgi:hypothetical protein